MKNGSFTSKLIYTRNVFAMHTNTDETRKANEARFARGMMHVRLCSTCDALQTQMKLTSKAKAAISAKANSTGAVKARNAGKTGKATQKTVAVKAAGKAKADKAAAKAASDAAKATLQAALDKAKALRDKGTFAFHSHEKNDVVSSNAGTRFDAATRFGVSVAALNGLSKINRDECATLASFASTLKKGRFSDALVTFASGETKNARVDAKAGIGSHAGAGKMQGKTLFFALAWTKNIGTKATAKVCKFRFAADGRTVEGKVLSETENSVSIITKDGVFYGETSANDNNAHCYGALIK